MPTTNIYQETLDSLKSCKSIDLHMEDLKKIRDASKDRSLNSVLANIISQLSHTIKTIKRNNPDEDLQKQILSQKRSLTSGTGQYFEMIIDYCTENLN